MSLRAWGPRASGSTASGPGCCPLTSGAVTVWIPLLPEPASCEIAVTVSAHGCDFCSACALVMSGAVAVPPGSWASSELVW